MAARDRTDFTAASRRVALLDDAQLFRRGNGAGWKTQDWLTWGPAPTSPSAPAPRSICVSADIQHDHETVSCELRGLNFTECFVSSPLAQRAGYLKCMVHDPSLHGLRSREPNAAQPESAALITSLHDIRLQCAFGLCLGGTSWTSPF